MTSARAAAARIRASAAARSSICRPSPPATRQSFAASMKQHHQQHVHDGTRQAANIGSEQLVQKQGWKSPVKAGPWSQHTDPTVSDQPSLSRRAMPQRGCPQQCSWQGHGRRLGRVVQAPAPGSFGRQAQLPAARRVCGGVGTCGPRAMQRAGQAPPWSPLGTAAARAAQRPPSAAPPRLLPNLLPPRPAPSCVATPPVFGVLSCSL